MWKNNNNSQTQNQVQSPSCAEKSRIRFLQLDQKFSTENNASRASLPPRMTGHSDVVT